jgi:hypothetical protein
VKSGIRRNAESYADDAVGPKVLAVVGLWEFGRLLQKIDFEMF